MYSYKKQVKMSYNEAVEKLKIELKKEGFGILTEINVKETLKKKLDVDYDKYIILGACNPPFAYEALKSEKEIGLLLPCNVLVYEDNKDIFVSTLLPTIAMGFVNNINLKNVAIQVEDKLKKVIDNV